MHLFSKANSFFFSNLVLTLRASDIAVAFQGRITDTIFSVVYRSARSPRDAGARHTKPNALIRRKIAFLIGGAIRIGSAFELYAFNVRTALQSGRAIANRLVVFDFA